MYIMNNDKFVYDRKISNLNIYQELFLSSSYEYILCCLVLDKLSNSTEIQMAENQQSKVPTITVEQLIILETLKLQQQQEKRKIEQVKLEQLKAKLKQKQLELQIATSETEEIKED